GGKVLLDAGVTVHTSGERSAPGSGGTFVGPVAPGAVTVELLRNGFVLDHMARSRKPSVTLVSPKKGTKLKSGHSLDVAWRASDPDHDKLDATVDFSADRGKTWTTVVQSPNRGHALVPSKFLAGSRHA